MTIQYLAENSSLFEGLTESDSLFEGVDYLEDCAAQVPFEDQKTEEGKAGGSKRPLHR